MGPNRKNFPGSRRVRFRRSPGANARSAANRTTSQAGAQDAASNARSPASCKAGRDHSAGEKDAAAAHAAGSLCSQM
ncbi:hypothetical protein J6U78_03820 [bacterium]|nr:hypothetical protein [bacterium]